MSFIDIDSIKDRLSDLFREGETRNRGIKITAAVGMIALSLLIGAASVRHSRKPVLSEVFQKLGTGDLSGVTQLVTDDKSILKQTDLDGNTPLHIAVSSGSIELTRSLLDAGAEVNVPNKAGLIPLAAAIEGERHQLEIATLLIGRGASPEASLPSGETLLHLAAATPKLDPRLIALLASKPGALAARDSQGRTPLEVAKAHGQSQLYAVLTRGNASLADSR